MRRNSTKPPINRSRQKEIDEIENRIVKKLINVVNINMRAKRWLT